MAAGYPPDESIPHDSRLNSILRKQESIRQLFAAEGHKLEIQPLDSGTSLWCFPRIRGPVTFSEGQWVELCDYTVNFDVDEVFGGLVNLPEDNFGGIYISKANEQWSVESADEANRTWRVTHDISAVGKRHYTSGTLNREAWEEARAWVQPKLGLDSTRVVATGTLNLENMGAYNYLRNERVDKRGGTYSVLESWLAFNASGVASGLYPSVEDYQVNTRIDEGGRARVTVDGTIRGLEVRNNSTYALQTTKWTNANSYFTNISGVIHGRAQSLSGLTLHLTPSARTIGKNQINGVITYGFEYTDRPNPSINGALLEDVVVTDEYPNDVFASHIILGRYAGPLLQSIQASGARRRSLTIELAMPPQSQSFTPTRPDTTSLRNSNSPGAGTQFMERDVETWSARTGRYSRQTAWVYEQ